MAKRSSIFLYHLFHFFGLKIPYCEWKNEFIYTFLHKTFRITTRITAISWDTYFVYYHTTWTTATIHSPNKQRHRIKTYLLAVIKCSLYFIMIIRFIQAQLFHSTIVPFLALSITFSLSLSVIIGIFNPVIRFFHSQVYVGISLAVMVHSLTVFASWSSFSISKVSYQIITYNLLSVAGRTHEPSLCLPIW